MHLEGKRMLRLAAKLQPIYRSILGTGIRESINIFKQLHPEFKTLKFKSGHKVFDWTIPEEWTINDAYIESENGTKYADFSKCSLHLMGYSTPVNKYMKKKELMKKIHTIPDYPEAIPYVTSYYKKDWGFCIDQNTLNEMPDCNYKVFIDSNFIKGRLELIEAVIPGQSKEEIFFSSYICHPFMVNNELSGPVLLSSIMDYVKKLDNQFYTYRFAIFPETIGSIAYLSKKYKLLKKRMMCGFHLTCVGDERGYSMIESKYSNTLADELLKAHANEKADFKSYSFLERRSDERQYGMARIDLPICTFSRSKPGGYHEYHTHLDDFSVVTEQGLGGSYDLLVNLINTIELGLYPCSSVMGEPMLGKRSLYPNTSIRDMSDSKREGRLLLDILAYCDGTNSTGRIAELLNLPISLISDKLQTLILMKLCTRQSNS